MPEIEKYAIIVAGGKGVRMGNAIPKQFLLLHGKPVLYYAIKAFADALPDIKIILVLPKEHFSYAQMVLQAFPERIDVTIVSGGETRFHSVRNGLSEVSKGSVVFVHDGVRPMVSPELILRCYAQALEQGSAIPAVAVADSMRLEEDGGSRPVDREKLRVIQTPQTFKADILLAAFGQDYDPSFTDEATVAEANGTKVYLVAGERSNMKVTTPEDMVIAEALLAERQ